MTRSDICKKTIPINSKECPECGDPAPFETVMESVLSVSSPSSGIDTKSIRTNHSKEEEGSIQKEIKIPEAKHTTRFSWKAFIVASLLAVILNAIVAGITRSNSTGNVIWTAIWFYLTIRAWKYWSWKALIPYPVYGFLVFIAFQISSEAQLGETLIVTSIVLNFGGLIIFAKLLESARSKFENP